MLVLYGGESATLPRAELLAWLSMTKDLDVEPFIVADDAPHSEGAVAERVSQAIRSADKAIALVTVDARSEFGAPNVLEEIGRWAEGKSPRTLCVVRQEGTKVNSNMHGAVYLHFNGRIKEAYEGIRKFLADAADEAKVARRPKSPTEDVVVNSSSSVLLAGRFYRRIRVDEVEGSVTAVLDCNDADAAAIRSLQRRSQQDLTFGNHVIRGRLDEQKLSHQGQQQIATIVLTYRDGDNGRGGMGEAGWGGGGSVGQLSADEIGRMRASRLLTDEPKAKNEIMGPEMLIRGVGQCVAVDRSPIPAFLSSRDLSAVETWEHLRLELVRQLILSHSVDRVERLDLDVENGKLVRVKLRGIRQPYPGFPPFVVEIDAPVSF